MELQVLAVNCPQALGQRLQHRLRRHGEENKDLAGLVPVPGQSRELNREAERRVRSLHGLLRRSQVGPDDEVELAYLRFHDSILTVSEDGPQSRVSDRARTGDLHLGKVLRYQLRHTHMVTGSGAGPGAGSTRASPPPMGRCGETSGSYWH